MCGVCVCGVCVVCVWCVCVCGVCVCVCVCGVCGVCVCVCGVRVCVCVFILMFWYSVWVDDTGICACVLIHVYRVCVFCSGLSFHLFYEVLCMSCLSCSRFNTPDLNERTIIWKKLAGLLRTYETLYLTDQVFLVEALEHVQFGQLTAAHNIVQKLTREALDQQCKYV